MEKIDGKHGDYTLGRMLIRLRWTESEAKVGVKRTKRGSNSTEACEGITFKLRKNRKE